MLGPSYCIFPFKASTGSILAILRGECIRECMREYMKEYVIEYNRIYKRMSQKLGRDNIEWYYCIHCKQKPDIVEMVIIKHYTQLMDLL